MAAPQIGQEAPDFVGYTDENNALRLHDFQGSIVVLYFYPRSNTPGCTRQACSFRDNMIRLVGMGVKVVGVSTDNVNRQAGFKAKNALNFPLIADAETEISQLYGVLRDTGKSANRVTFLIDRNGVIRHIWRNVRANNWLWFYTHLWATGDATALRHRPAVYLSPRVGHL